MKLTDLKEEQLIELCKLRLKHDKEDFTKIIIEDSTFKHFYGVSFIIESEEWENYRFAVACEKFYPDEYMYLLGLGVEF